MPSVLRWMQLFGQMVGRLLIANLEEALRRAAAREHAFDVPPGISLLRSLGELREDLAGAVSCHRASVPHRACRAAHELAAYAEEREVLVLLETLALGAEYAACVRHAAVAALRSAPRGLGEPALARGAARLRRRIEFEPHAIDRTLVVSAEPKPTTATTNPHGGDAVLALRV